MFLVLSYPHASAIAVQLSSTGLPAEQALMKLGQNPPLHIIN